MGVLNDVSKHEPIQYREVINILSYLTTAQGTLNEIKIFINQVSDQDFKQLLEDVVQKGLMTEIEILQSLLSANGIALPSAPPFISIQTTTSGSSDNDAKIAADVSADIAAGLLSFSKIIGQSTHEDIGGIFGQFHISKAQTGSRLIRLMKEKGWLNFPALNIQQPAKS